MVELFAEGRDGSAPVRKAMDRGAQLPDNAFLFTATVDANRPASDYTARLIPYHPNASVPLEASEISWQK
jgi:starch phosphorylase